MPVNDPIRLDAYAQMAERAYFNIQGNLDNVQFDNSSYAEIGQVINQPLGFQARAFYNAQLNEVVIAYAGTEGAPGNAFGGFNALEFLQDLTTNVGVGTIGDGFQVNNAVDFADDSFDEPELVGVPPFNLTLVGHSLGGFLAQSASLQGFGPNNQRADNVVVFNSPGVGGFAQLPVVGALPEDSYTYVYSPSDTWSSLAGAIHSVGYQLSDNILVVENAVDHAIAAIVGNPAGISDALTNDPLTTSPVNSIDLAEEPFQFSNTNEISQGIAAAVALLSIQELLEISDALDAVEDILSGSESVQTPPPIDGTNAADTLDGTANSDVINGLDGNDTITALTGDDTIDGGAGNDVINADDGNDVIRGGNQYDTIYAGAGNDTVWGDNGRDVVFLGAGDDVFNDNAQSDANGYDSVHGGDGADTLNGAGGNDTLRGDNGNDILIGGVGADLIDGGTGQDRAQYHLAATGLIADLLDASLNTGEAAGDTYISVENLFGTRHNDDLRGDTQNNALWGHIGDDVIYARAGNDVLFGGGGNDTLFGQYGNDTLKGDDGNDVLVGGVGADLIDGGAGQDRAQYNQATTGLIADLSDISLNTGEAAGDTYISVENLFGSLYDDDLRGDDQNNALWGHTGDDALRGRAGDDVLLGDLGDDLLEGEDGNDFLDGGDGNDLMGGGAGFDQLFGQSGNDALWGDGGDDSLFGGEGQDTLGGGSGNDSLRGQNGHDSIGGGEGNDTLYGNAGNDTLLGWGGFDVILGGTGDDVMTGGANTDWFVFSANAGNDTINDFDANDDSERLHFDTTTGVNQLTDLTISQTGNNALITFGGNSLTLVDVGIANLQESDFVFF